MLSSKRALCDMRETEKARLPFNQISLTSMGKTVHVINRAEKRKMSMNLYSFLQLTLCLKQLGTGTFTYFKGK